VNEEVVDLFHKVINATIIVVSNPREKVRYFLNESENAA
jgi:hypothetical protein